MTEAEKAAIIATLGATQAKLELVAAEIHRLTRPHRVIQSELDGSAYFSIQDASELFDLAEAVAHDVAWAVRSVEG